MSGLHPSGIDQIDVRSFAQLKAEAEANDRPLQLIDVREPQELEIAGVPGFESLPLSQYGEWSSNILKHFDPTVETIVMCHLGMRSAQMCQWLMGQGFTQVKNLSGGIEAYSLAVDSSIPRY